jgi:purine-binding chemotaxis protein CheW
MSDTQQLCTFSIGGVLFGVDVTRVQEVTRCQELTPVPLSRNVAGLINLRGQIVTAIDMRSILELPPRSPEQQAMSVVVYTEDGTVSLLVDEIGDVVTVSSAAFERPPTKMRGPSQELVTGLYKVDATLLLVLDVPRAVRRAGAHGRAA